MINIIDIEGKPYPFRFGMRLLWSISAKRDLEFEQLYVNMQKDYDLCLEIFVEANKYAVKKEGGNLITADSLEEAIDADTFGGGDGVLMKKLFSAFQAESKGQNHKPRAKKKTTS